MDDVPESDPLQEKIAKFIDLLVEQGALGKKVLQFMCENKHDKIVLESLRKIRDLKVKIDNAA